MPEDFSVSPSPLGMGLTGLGLGLGGLGTKGFGLGLDNILYDLHDIGMHIQNIEHNLFYTLKSQHFNPLHKFYACIINMAQTF